MVLNEYYKKQSEEIFNSLEKTSDGQIVLGKPDSDKKMAKLEEFNLKILVSNRGIDWILKTIDSYFDDIKKYNEEELSLYNKLKEKYEN